MTARRPARRLLLAPLALVATGAGLEGCPPPEEAPAPASAAAAPAAQSALMQSAPADVGAAVRAAFPEHVWDDALAVSRCESTWLVAHPSVTSPGAPNAGLFQINRVHRGRVAALGFSWDQVRLDPNVNAVVAADIWAEAGWRPWTCRKVLPQSRW